MKHVRPCPRCGEEPTMARSARGLSVVCIDCQYGGPERQTRVEAETAWDEAHAGTPLDTA